MDKNWKSRAQNEGGFRVRLDDHKKASLLKNHEDRESNFCVPCPTGRLGLKGTCEGFQQHAAFGCNKRNKNEVDKMTMSSNCFDWTKACVLKDWKLKSKACNHQNTFWLLTYLSAVTICCCPRITTHRTSLDMGQSLGNVVVRKTDC